MSKNIIDKVNEVLKAITEYSAPIKGTDIAELVNMPYSTVKNYIQKLKDSGKIVSTKDGYLPAEEKVSPKNHEGYSDPTAQKAIERADKYAWLKPGYIWNVESNSGCTYPNLIIRVNNSREVIVLTVEEAQHHDQGAGTNEVGFAWNGKPWVVKTDRIFTFSVNKFRKAFPTKQYTSLDLQRVLEQVGSFLSIPVIINANPTDDVKRLEEECKLITETYNNSLEVIRTITDEKLELEKELEQTTKIMDELTTELNRVNVESLKIAEDNYKISTENTKNDNEIRDAQFRADFYEQAFYSLIDRLAPKRRVHSRYNYT